MSERREFTRVPLSIDILLSGGDRLEVRACTQDLSLRGVRVSHLDQIQQGENCELCLVLGEGPQAVRVEISGRVVRADADGVGVEFLGIRGAESLEHLRRLILHNAPSAPEAEDEMSRHCGLKRRIE
ncbi:MAG: PilZ domain-containing protein [bacterium]|jgi:hypothetical protein|nr:PilZ domain-containing protein [bacterium]